VFLIILLLYKKMGAEEFDYAKDRVWDLPDTPSNDDLLKLYKLFFTRRYELTGRYKQATVGDCNTGRPGGWDLKGQRKWDAWNSARGNISLGDTSNRRDVWT
jgi:diazepam-binding inhibitor (GABA receptor modulator, acyl-CoA-binding protein)